MEHFAAQLCRRERIAWDSREQAVRARRTVELDALMLEDKPLAAVPADGARAAMLAGVRELGIGGACPGISDARDLQARIAFVRSQLAARQRRPAGRTCRMPRCCKRLRTWLAPWLEGVTRREHLARMPLSEALRALLGGEQQRRAGRVGARRT